MTDVMEREANLFAMELLMPTAFMMEDLKDGIDIEDSKEIARLAKRYKVSEQLMSMRIAQLMFGAKL
jgi:Zn-dependent peptidase ImmA (M78 family)